MVNAEYLEDGRWIFVDCQRNTTYGALWNCALCVDYEEEATRELGYTLDDKGRAELWFSERDDFISALDLSSPEIQQAVAAKDARSEETVNSIMARIVEKLQAIVAECLITGAVSGKDWSIQYVDAGEPKENKTKIKFSCLVLYYYVPIVPEIPFGWIPAVYRHPLGQDSDHVIEFLDPYSGSWISQTAAEHDICPFNWSGSQVDDLQAVFKAVIGKCD